MKKYLYIIGLIIALSFSTTNSFAQRIAVKSNILYDATTSMNLGVEIGLAPKWSLDISGNYNPWKFDETRLRHFLIQPEARYWFCEKFNGHFIGLHAHYAKYNVGGMSFLSDNMKNHRYQGNLWGAGFSYGYQWILSNHWSIEGVIGVGYARLDYDKYPCTNCGTVLKHDKKNYIGPTKAAVSIIYVIK